jgi:acyl-CoA thioesterase
MDDLAIAKRCGEKLWETDAALRVLGISVEVTDTGSAEAKFEVRPDMLNGHGVCHGGYLFTLADTAFAYACNGYNKLTVPGRQNRFLRRIAEEPGRKRHRRLPRTITQHKQGADRGIMIQKSLKNPEKCDTFGGCKSSEV